MTQCKQCGADLPGEARFCLQCGTPVQPDHPEVPAPEPAVPTPPPNLDFVRPALTGGTFLGVLSSLPIVSAGNCLCCMWLWGGGAIAAFLLSKQQTNRQLTYGDGAFAGVSSGLFGAMIGTLISIPLKIVSAPFLESQREQMEKLFQDAPEFLDLIRQFMSPEISATTLVLTFISNLILYALFAMIGGILMVAYLNNAKSKKIGL